MAHGDQLGGRAGSDNKPASACASRRGWRRARSPGRFLDHVIGTLVIKATGGKRAAALAAALGACALSGPQFQVTKWAPDQQGFGCPLEMVDRESGATLSVRRVESIAVVPAGTTPTAGQDVIGDYEVTPEGALGVGKGQLLRIDCKTRQALAIVPAGP